MGPMRRLLIPLLVILIGAATVWQRQSPPVPAGEVAAQSDLPTEALADPRSDRTWRPVPLPQRWQRLREPGRPAAGRRPGLLPRVHRAHSGVPGPGRPPDRHRWYASSGVVLHRRSLPEFPAHQPRRAFLAMNREELADTLPQPERAGVFSLPAHDIADTRRSGGGAPLRRLPRQSGGLHREQRGSRTSRRAAEFSGLVWPELGRACGLPHGFQLARSRRATC